MKPIFIAMLYLGFAINLQSNFHWQPTGSKRVDSLIMLQLTLNYQAENADRFWGPDFLRIISHSSGIEVQRLPFVPIAGVRIIAAVYPKKSTR